MNTQHAQKNRISLEFFPPSSDESATRFFSTVKEFEEMEPDFISVTYGAGGTTKDRTLDALKRLKRQSKVNLASHLTCVGASRLMTDAVVEELKRHGINHIVALRGDPPEGIGTAFQAHESGYQNAADLVKGISTIGGFEISVSAYPEKHPESADWDEDIAMLKLKQDNGATRAITQFFFDNDLYEAYLERVRKAGVTIPIVPGILPIHDFSKVKRFAFQCGSSIPDKLESAFEKADLGLNMEIEANRRKQAEASKEIAVEIAAAQIEDLVRRGVDHFHFYTMNRSDLIKKISVSGGLRPSPDTNNDNIAA